MRVRTSPQTLSTRRNCDSGNFSRHPATARFHKTSLLARWLVQLPGNTPPLPSARNYTQHSITFNLSLRQPKAIALFANYNYLSN